jgi:hypothetical protein
MVLCRDWRDIGRIWVKLMGVAFCSRTQPRSAGSVMPLIAVCNRSAAWLCWPATTRVERLARRDSFRAHGAGVVVADRGHGELAALRTAQDRGDEASLNRDNPLLSVRTPGSGGGQTELASVAHVLPLLSAGWAVVAGGHPVWHRLQHLAVLPSRRRSTPTCWRAPHASAHAPGKAAVLALLEAGSGFADQAPRSWRAQISCTSFEDVVAVPASPTVPVNRPRI